MRNMLKLIGGNACVDGAIALGAELVVLSNNRNAISFGKLIHILE
jgi:hypothetical protein